MHTSALHIPRDTYGRLQDAAYYRAKEKRTRISVSALITEVVEEWLDARDRGKQGAARSMQSGSVVLAGMRGSEF